MSRLIVITVQGVVQPVADTMRKLIKEAPNGVLLDLPNIAEHGRNEGVEQNMGLIFIISQVTGGSFSRYSSSY